MPVLRGVEFRERLQKRTYDFSIAVIRFCGNNFNGSDDRAPQARRRPQFLTLNSPILNYSNSFASSAHSPFGASSRYSRQCGLASGDRPIFSSVTAR